MISKSIIPNISPALAMSLLMVALASLGRAETQTPTASQPASPAAPQSAGNDTTQPLNPRDLAATPSRNIAPEQLKTYVESVSTVFSMRHRATDPFGLPQDPNAKPVVKPKLATTRKFEPIKATPFSDIVRLIKVTTVMPAERAFLIGNRHINQGDRLPITFRGKNIMIEVAAVGSSKIDFRNLEDGETATLSLNLMPAGMRPGADGIAAPGMEPENANAPINLDGNAIPLNAVQNR